MQLTFEGKTIDQLAIELIRAYEPPQGYYLGFSGGKDSVVIADLTQRAAVKFQAVYNVSPIDPPQIRAFVKSEYPNVIWENNAKGFFSHHFMSNGVPMRHMRWCCEIIKEAGGKGRVKILGMRRAESWRRARYDCFSEHKKSGCSWLLPILNWSDADVWQYIGERHLPVCGLYRDGFTRIGCVLCPFESKEQIAIDLQYFPSTVRLWQLACNRYIQERNTNPNRKKTTWKTGEEYFNWWIKR